MQKRILYHIAFWVTYILYKSYLNFDSSSSNSDDENVISLFLETVLIQLVFVLVKIPLVYSLFYATDRYLSKQWSVFKTMLIVVVLFTLALFSFTLAGQLIVNSLIKGQNPELWTSLTSLQSISYCFFILAFVSGIAISIKLIRLNIKQKIAEQELLKKKLEIELQFLKAQSNPHFLFNTLNNIYGLARKNSDKTADVVLRLSGMLRYMLYETANESIAIEKEIQMINDYIELEKLRYTNRLEVNFNHSIDNYKEKIAPLILLPFVENAFKHGAGESRFESYITINLTLKDWQLFYEIKNSKEEVLIAEEDKIGLRNIKRQLELLYPNHRLYIDHNANEFIVTLQINLNDGKI
ncbi:MAG TPA: histidine kinase [Flavobacterium sp.]|jgi:two-component system LytT family sensor kinase|nr:histidine kinase [Flavobacterium sp.]HPJ11488.1 histidine kinase [Flavobacterium sp.]